MTFRADIPSITGFQNPVGVLPGQMLGVPKTVMGEVAPTTDGYLEADPINLTITYAVNPQSLQTTSPYTLNVQTAEPATNALPNLPKSMADGLRAFVNAASDRAHAFAQGAVNLFNRFVSTGDRLAQQVLDSFDDLTGPPMVAAGVGARLSVVETCNIPGRNTHEVKQSDFVNRMSGAGAADEWTQLHTVSGKNVTNGLTFLPDKVNPNWTFKDALIPPDWLGKGDNVEVLFFQVTCPMSYYCVNFNGNLLEDSRGKRKEYGAFIEVGDTYYFADRKHAIKFERGRYDGSFKIIYLEKRVVQSAKEARAYEPGISADYESSNAEPKKSGPNSESRSSDDIKLSLVESQAAPIGYRVLRTYKLEFPSLFRTGRSRWKAWEALGLDSNLLDKFRDNGTFVIRDGYNFGIEKIPQDFRSMGDYNAKSLTINITGLILRLQDGVFLQIKPLNYEMTYLYISVMTTAADQETRQASGKKPDERYSYTGTAGQTGGSGERDNGGTKSDRDPSKEMTYDLIEKITIDSTGDFKNTYYYFLRNFSKESNLITLLRRSDLYLSKSGSSWVLNLNNAQLFTQLNFKGFHRDFIASGGVIPNGASIESLDGSERLVFVCSNRKPNEITIQYYRKKEPKVKNDEPAADERQTGSAYSASDGNRTGFYQMPVYAEPSEEFRKEFEVISLLEKLLNESNLKEFIDPWRRLNYNIIELRSSFKPNIVEIYLRNASIDEVERNFVILEEFVKQQLGEKYNKAQIEGALKDIATIKDSIVTLVQQKINADAAIREAEEKSRRESEEKLKREQAAAAEAAKRAAKEKPYDSFDFDNLEDRSKELAAIFYSTGDTRYLKDIPQKVAFENRRILKEVHSSNKIKVDIFWEAFRSLCLLSKYAPEVYDKLKASLKTEDKEARKKAVRGVVEAEHPEKNQHDKDSKYRQGVSSDVTKWFQILKDMK